MLCKGILNPALLALLARVRHTNALVISDRGFHCWPQIETVDISLVDGVPLLFEPHVEFKKRVPSAVGLIRTGDTVQYANLILESA